MARAKLVSTKHITITSATGERLKDPVWSKPRMWRRSKNNATNLLRAITHANNVLEQKRIGTVVYVGDMPVYHCKWGAGKAFTGWKANPAAEYWRRKLSK